MQDVGNVVVFQRKISGTRQVINAHNKYL